MKVRQTEKVFPTNAKCVGTCCLPCLPACTYLRPPPPLRDEPFSPDPSLASRFQQPPGFSQGEVGAGHRGLMPQKGSGGRRARSREKRSRPCAGNGAAGREEGKQHPRLKPSSPGRKKPLRLPERFRSGFQLRFLSRLRGRWYLFAHRSAWMGLMSVFNRCQRLEAPAALCFPEGRGWGLFCCVGGALIAKGYPLIGPRLVLERSL